MDSTPQCPQCQSPHVYPDANLWVCPECGHEWSLYAAEQSLTPEPLLMSENVVRDANGTALADGDAVSVVKELRIKGASSVVKVGTKVKNIRLNDLGDGHNIACKIEGIGAIHLKSQFVRKVTAP